MKFLHLSIYRLASLRAFLLLAGLGMLISLTPASRAGVTIHLDINRDNTGGTPYYLYFPSLMTNSLTPVPADTGYFAWSSSSTSNSGAYAQLLPDGSTPSGGTGFGDDYPAFVHDLTNLWTLMVTNLTSTNIYYFKFSSFASNSLPLVTVLFPTNNATNVTNMPTFRWSGPTNYDSIYAQVADINGPFFESASLATTQTNWTPPNPIPYAETFSFFPDYSHDASASIVSTAPTNNLGQPLTGWTSTCELTVYASVNFTVTDPFAGGPVPLGYALNNTNLIWVTNGDAGWVGEYPVSYDGVAAARSGVLQDNQTSVLQTTVTGPGALSFWWETDGEADNFTLQFSIDGASQVELMAQQNFWQQASYNIPAGAHTLSWTAAANTGSATDDFGYVDVVTFTPYMPPAPGLWTATGALTNAPYLHTATLLPNGKVLVAGGSDNNGYASAGAQLYNPATGTWSSTNTMGKARFGHTATLLPNGKVLVVGGITNYDNASLVQTVELFNPTNSTWANTGALKFPRYGHTATLLANGKVLVAGGTGTNLPNPNLTNIYPTEVYDPATGLWATNDPLLVGRFGHTATLLTNGKVLIAAGETTNYSIVTGECELYDPTTGNIAVTGQLPYPTANHTATLLPSGLVLAAAGDIDIGSPGGVGLYPYFNAALFDPNTETWTLTGSLNKGHDYHTATLLANGLVLVAGYATYNSTNDSAELYDPASAIWTTAAPMKFPRVQHTATLLPNGKVLVVGGFLATAELYDSTGAAIIVLTNPTRLTNGTFQFVWTNTPGSTNVVLLTTNVATVSTNWTVQAGATEVTAGHFQFTDLQATNSTKRFYRVRSP